MTDLVSKEVRSRMMAGIRAKDTKPEIIVRKAIHARGLRFRLHRKDLHGKPDIVLPRFKAVIFIHGCFWHGHECQLFHWPASNPEFWKNKITGNRRRDIETAEKLIGDGWRVARVWECAVRGRNKDAGEVARKLDVWLHSTDPILEIEG